MKPEQAVAIIEQGIKKPPKPRRVASPSPSSSMPRAVLDRGGGLDFGGGGGDDIVEVVKVSRQ